MGPCLAGRPALLCVAMPLIFGCAASPEKPLPDHSSLRLGRVALQVTGETQFTFGSAGMAKEDADAIRPAAAFLGCPAMAAGMVALNPLTVAGVIFVLPACVIGQFVFEPNLETAAARRSADQLSGNAVAKISFSRVIETEALDYAGKTGLNLTVHVDGAAELPDSLIEIAVPRVFVIADGRKPLRLVPRIEATVRVLRRHDRAVLDGFEIGFWGEARLAEDMLRNEGLLLREEIRTLVAEVAERAVDEVLLVTRTPAVASAKQQQSRVPDYALQPLQPPLRVRSPLSLSLSREVLYGWLDRIRVADLQPEFVWEARPRAIGPLPGTGITYDFRLFLEPDNLEPLPSLFEGIQENTLFLPNGVAPVYERFGLLGPRHRPDPALEPCRKYRWTVRARWVSGAVAHATEWMGAWNTIGGSLDPRWQRRGIDFVGLASVEDSPLLFYAPFITPSADGRSCPDQ